MSVTKLNEKSPENILKFSKHDIQLINASLSDYMKIIVDFIIR